MLVESGAQRVSSREETVKLTFTVVRVVDGNYQETALSEHDEIRAGDILRAQLELPNAAAPKAIVPKAVN